MLLHHIGLQPHTHGVGFHTRRLHIADTLHTFQRRNDVDVSIVGDELVIVAAIGRHQCIHENLRVLTLLYLHTNLSYL